MDSGYIMVGLAIVLIVVGYGLTVITAPPEKTIGEQEPTDEEEYVGTGIEGEPLRPRDLCESLCKEKLASGMDLSHGPCLSNQLAADWVCDVAHDPRKAIDNDPENQCSEFGVTANHFVEVTPKCKFITEK